MNYLQMKKLEKTWTGYINRSVRAYERNDTKNKNKYADLLEKEIKAINPNVKIDWPGLYPCFELNDVNAYDVEHLINLMF